MVLEAKEKEKLDDVDLILAAEDGQIKRSRDPKMCHHNARQKCAHCLPIDAAFQRMVLEAKEKEKLDDVDLILAAEDGQIKRSRDPKMCHHNARQKCAHCLPIDPYDEDYLKSKDIKHMSFHAHVRNSHRGMAKAHS
ncbi:hypothetical protein OSTOST_06934 [Ostertagia ostertagi]